MLLMYVEHFSNGQLSNICIKILAKNNAKIRDGTDSTNILATETFNKLRYLPVLTCFLTYLLIAAEKCSVILAVINKHLKKEDV